jgi:hypothetical protein
VAASGLSFMHRESSKSAQEQKKRDQATVICERIYSNPIDAGSHGIALVTVPGVERRGNNTAVRITVSSELLI